MASDDPRQPEQELSVGGRIDLLCDQFEAAWERGEPRLEEYLARVSQSQAGRMFRELLEVELEVHKRRGASPDLDAYRARFPERVEAVNALFLKVLKRQRLGDYELLEELGQGGMGVVYKARQVFLNQIVAVKVLPEKFLDERQAVLRFRREMKLIGQLEHPNIVRAYYAGEQSGAHFLAMEYVNGVTLEGLVERHGALPPGAACELVRQTALGLQSAHEHELVHRDIKPANLMLSTTGTVKILDLGLARLHGTQGTQGLTVAGGAMGTLDYMAPEQWDDSSAVDIRADIYSLGCTLFYLLTCEAPYGGKSFNTISKKFRAHAMAPIPSILTCRRDCPKELDNVLRRMLAKQAEERFSTPAEVAAALAPLANAAQLANLKPREANPIRPAISSGSVVTATETDTSRAPKPPARGWRPSGWSPRSRPALRAFKTVALLSVVAAMIGGGVWTARQPWAKWPSLRRDGEVVAPKRPKDTAPTPWKEELTLLPALNGGWWFDEMPWLVPFARRAMAQALDDPRNRAVLAYDAAAGHSPWSDPDVIAVQKRLRKLADRCLPTLSPLQQELFKELLTIGQSDFDAIQLTGRLQTALKAFAARSGDGDSWPAEDLHTRAVLEHHLATLGNDLETATKAAASYEAALAKYRSGNEDQPLLRLLCLADSALLHAVQLGEAQDARRRYQEAKGRLTEARTARDLPLLFQVDVLVRHGDAAVSASEYGDAEYAFMTAEKLLETLGPAAPKHPLAAYVQEAYAWSLTDQWILDRAREKFAAAERIRNDSLDLSKNENGIALVHVFHDRHGQAILSRYMGRVESARVSFETLLGDIQKAIAANESRAGDPTRHRYGAKLRERLCNSWERYADCVLYGGAASAPNPAELAKACSLYQKAGEESADPAVRATMAYKRAIAQALAGQRLEEIRRAVESPDAASRRRLALKVLGVPATEASKPSPAPNAAPQNVTGAASEQARLLERVAKAVLAFKEQGPEAGHDALAGFVRQLIQGEFTVSDQHRREALELQLLSAELLISAAESDRKHEDGKHEERKSDDLKYLDTLLTTFPRRAQLLPFLRRYYDLAIEAVGDSDPDRAAGYILSSRDQPRSDKAVMVLFHLRARDGVAVVVSPSETKAAKSSLFRLSFGREQVKQKTDPTPLRLDDRLIQLVNAKRMAGRTIEIAWTDEKCWADPEQALTDKDFAPLAGQITIKTR